MAFFLVQALIGTALFGSPSFAGLECRSAEITAARKAVDKALAGRCSSIDDVKSAARAASALAEEAACDAALTAKIRHGAVAAKAAAWDSAAEECVNDLGETLSHLNDLLNRHGAVRGRPAAGTTNGPSAK